MAADPRGSPDGALRNRLTPALVVGQEEAHLGAGEGSGEEVALAAIAAERQERGPLGLGLDAVTSEVKCFGQRDERAVDLQRIHAETLQVAERAVAGAEIVDGQLNAQLLELVLCQDRRLGVVHDDTLSNLEFQCPGRQAGPDERVANISDQGRLLDRGNLPGGAATRAQSKRAAACQSAASNAAPSQ